MLEAEMAAQGVELIDSQEAKEYARDLLALLTETDIAKSKRFLRTFVDRIVIERSKGAIHYKLPVPERWHEKHEFSVLPIVSPSGAGVTIGRTFSFSFGLDI